MEGNGINGANGSFSFNPTQPATNPQALPNT